MRQPFRPTWSEANRSEIPESFYFEELTPPFTSFRNKPTKSGLLLRRLSSAPFLQLFQRTTRNRYGKIHATHDCAPWLYRFDLRREREPQSPQSSSQDAPQEERRTKSEPFSFRDFERITRSESFSFRNAQSLPDKATSRLMSDRPKKGSSAVAGGFSDRCSH
jgi:hypothetical protein